MNTCFTWCVCILVILIMAMAITFDHFIHKKTPEYYFNSVVADVQSELVIARYNEDLNWLNDLPIVQDIELITIYNKGKPIDTSYINHPNVAVHEVSNVGRCDHTYLYHVCLRYDSLADITVFLPGSADYSYKWDVTKKILEKSVPHKKTMLSGFFTNNLKDSIADFRLDEWQASQEKNKSMNDETLLQPAYPRPFGKWYEANFYYDVEYITYTGIFAVSKTHILQNPHEHYKKFVQQLEVGSNPEVGHYTERSWAAIFHPIPSDSFCYD